MEKTQKAVTKADRQASIKTDEGDGCCEREPQEKEMRTETNSQTDTKDFFL